MYKMQGSQEPHESPHPDCAEPRHEFLGESFSKAEVEGEWKGVPTAPSLQGTIEIPGSENKAEPWGNCGLGGGP